MMTRSYHSILVVSAALLVLLGAGFLYKNSSRFHRDIPLTNERQLKVTLEAGMGDISIARGNPANVLTADISTERSSDLTRNIDYSTRDRIGYLSINTTDDQNQDESGKHHDRSFHFSGFESSMWDLKFTDAVPISFDMELGLGKGDFDLTGLTVKDLNLSTGASSVSLRFDKPNPALMEEMTIETGLSKFTGEGLCNANFNRFKFQGGVGGYTLDFSGKLERDVDVDIEVGFGSLTVRIPDDVGVKIIYEKSLIAHIDLASDFSEKGEDTYYSSNYHSADHKMNMRIEAGLGSVKIKRE